MFKSLLLGAVIWLALIWAVFALTGSPAHCEGWVCFGPCGTASDCGYGCACVGASTGVGSCVSL